MSDKDITALDTFKELRSLLFPDRSLRYWVLDVDCKDRDLRAARECIRYGKLDEAETSLSSLRDRLGSTPAYWLTVAYLATVHDHVEEARRAFERIFVLPEVESRQVLSTWSHLRDLGVKPPKAWNKRVLGVVCEMAMGAETHFTVVAGFADGQIRMLCHPGPSLIGETWTESEMQVAQRLVERGQEVIEHFHLTEDRSLPRPGFGCFHLLTPGGIYRLVADLDEWKDEQHPLHELAVVAGKLSSITFYLVGAATKQLSPPQKNEALVDAVQRRDVDRVKFFLDAGADANAKVSNDTGLQEAPVLCLPAANGSVEILELLLDRGADVNAGDATGLTALMIASYVGETEILDFLIQNGARIDAQDTAGYSALMFAANAGQVACVEILLDADANVEARDNGGNVPLAFAAQHGYREVVELLLGAGADPLATGNHGHSVIDLADLNGYTGLATMLRKNRSN